MDAATGHGIDCARKGPRISGRTLFTHDSAGVRERKAWRCSSCRLMVSSEVGPLATSCTLLFIIIASSDAQRRVRAGICISRTPCNVPLASPVRVRWRSSQNRVAAVWSALRVSAVRSGLHVDISSGKPVRDAAKTLPQTANVPWCLCLGCIEDWIHPHGLSKRNRRKRRLEEEGNAKGRALIALSVKAVSYTHLTLPTIYSV